MDTIVASNPISCSQPEGQPEILRILLHEGSPEGGDEVFIIGTISSVKFVYPISIKYDSISFKKVMIGFFL